MARPFGSVAQEDPYALAALQAVKSIRESGRRKVIYAYADAGNAGYYFIRQVV
jgi:hypothetical protein